MSLNKIAHANWFSNFITVVIIINAVAVVALFDAPLHNAVTTARDAAGVGAGVGVNGIAIVASFDPVMDKSITTLIKAASE